MVNAWKIGGGAGLILLGLFFMFKQADTLSSILGIISIALGLGLFASDK
ncbi:MAG: hypothetical protein AABX11_03700 [Nanoarchaeota archaeon]